MTQNEVRLKLLSIEIYRMARDHDHKIPTIWFNPEDINDMIDTSVKFGWGDGGMFCVFTINEIHQLSYQIMSLDMKDVLVVPVRIDVKRPRWIPWIGYK